MGFKSIALATTTLVLSTSVHAALVSTDWLTASDDLITTDTDTGLEWLDLTETNDMSYSVVVNEFGTGGLFEGFRYATSSEVVDLWANWSIDLSSGAINIVPGADPLINVATTFLGNIMCEYDCTTYPHGVLGLTSDSNTSGFQERLGAFNNALDNETHYDTDGHVFVDPIHRIQFLGSYVVRETVVPLPAAVWLFGSGLLGLIGLARRKKA